jgi:hypothetical protein
VLRSPGSIALAAAVAAATFGSLSAASADDPPPSLTAFAERDAAAGRSYLAPTALTAGGGHATLHLRLPLFPALAGSLAVALHDRLEVFVGGAAAVIPFEESNNPHRVVAGGAKLQLVRSPKLAVAIEGSAYRRPGYHEVDPFDPVEWDVPRLVVGEVGAVATACLDTSCAIVGSAHAHYIAEVWGGDEHGLWGGASFIGGRGKHRAVADLTIANPIDQEGTALLGYVGYRYASDLASCDVGALLFGADGDFLPWPTFGLSARW